MADEKQQQIYPDIPLIQWWNVRAVLIKKLPQNISLQYLKDVLGYEEATARGVYRNLIMFGFIDKDGNTTDRANQWRLNDQYPQICNDIMAEIYPEGLRDADATIVDRNYLINWFVRNTRVSQRFASKNAAVFELLREADPTNPAKAKEGKVSAGVPAKAQTRNAKPPRRALVQAMAAVQEPQVLPASENGNSRSPAEIKPEKPAISERLMTPSVHIDIQIHIAPDAPSQQIEDIFTAIEKHLYRPRSGE